jgi:amino acid transporter
LRHFLWHGVFHCATLLPGFVPNDEGAGGNRSLLAYVYEPVYQKHRPGLKDIEKSMAQKSVAPYTAQAGHEQESEHVAAGSMLGPILCWAVVFADIGTSVYYTPGILYGTVQNRSGFFVTLTLAVFVLLTLKYTEVTHRFPQGGGVVTVAAQAINRWFGALGGMFILVDYFLTAAISCLSGMQYLSVVIIPLGVTAFLPGLGTIQLPILILTIVILILLGILNWIGISESAKVSLVGAVIAFLSDIAILVTVFSHVSLSQFFALVPQVFAGRPLTFGTFLAGFAGSFLAFSGLESISQLSPVMKKPHKRVAGIAMVLVVVTVGLTSPLLTFFSTLLLPQAAGDPIKSAQIISLLAGFWGNTALQVEVAISASALLVFASNTAIIGAYHVFMALSRMEFLPAVILKRNKLRDTPHYSIMLATGIPIAILIIVKGNINILGDMYAFGLLGAFSLTCLGLDIVRYNDLRRLILARRVRRGQMQNQINRADSTALPEPIPITRQNNKAESASDDNSDTNVESMRPAWFNINFGLGVFTTFLVIVAWSTNLVTKPLATLFGGSVTIIGMSIAYFNYARHQKEGRLPAPLVSTHLHSFYPGSILAILQANSPHNAAIARAAINNADTRHPLLFLYLANETQRAEAPRMMEIVDPYLDDLQAKKDLGRAEGMAQKAGVPIRDYIYLQTKEAPDTVAQVWQTLHPKDTVVASEDEDEYKDINPDRIRYELTPDGRVAHLLKQW